MLKKGLALFFSIIALSGNVNSQGVIFNSHPAHNSALALMFYRPNIDFSFFGQSFGAATLGGKFQINANLAISDRSSFYIGFPFINAEYDDSRLGSETGVGNIALGFQKNVKFEEDVKTAIQFFLFLPTIDEKSAVPSMAFFSDITEFQTALPNTLTLQVLYAAALQPQKNLLFNYYFGPSILIPTGDNEGDAELLLNFAFEPHLRVDRLSIFIIFQGAFIVTASDDEVEDFGDRFNNKLGFGISYRSAKFEPKLSYQVFTNDEFNDVVDGVLLLGFNYYIGE